MIAIFTLLLIVIISLIVNRVATVALMFTGMSRDAARFQARSAFTGAGFTTLESEQIVTHPVRRRIVLLLMLLGNAGFVTMIATLLGGFIGIESAVGPELEGVSVVIHDASGEEARDVTATLEYDPTQAQLMWMDRILGPSRWARIAVRLLLLLLGLAAVWAVASSKWVDRRLSRIITWALKNFTSLDTIDYHGILHFTEGFLVEELQMSENHWATGRKIGDLRLGDEGIQVLGIQRADGTYLGSPTGESFVRTGDTLILYGSAEALASFRNREKGETGQAEHQRRVMEQLGEMVEQTKDERAEDREAQAET